MSIISHKHKFIFLKSRKTAGTSVSAALATLCGEEDILALSKDVIDSTSLSRQNIKIPLSNLSPYFLSKHVFSVCRDFTKVLTSEKKLKEVRLLPTCKQHMPAHEIKQAVGDKIWNSYYKFTIERNPYDRLISYYKWRAHRFGLDCSFEEFALSALGYNRKYNFAASGFSNIPFYSLDGSHISLDKVILFENLDQDLLNVLNVIGIQISSDFGWNCNKKVDSKLSHSCSVLFG